MTLLVLKWRSESIQFEFDREQMSAGELGSLISAKTGIPIERITLMVSGWSLKKFHDPEIPLKSCIPNQESFKGTLVGTPIGQEFNPPDCQNEEVPARDTTRQNTPPIRHGYVNLGNTCYMNAILSLLECCSKFVEIIKTHQIIRTTQLGRIWQALWMRKDPLKPMDARQLFEELCKACPSFGTRSTNNPLLNQQQDADECLTVLTTNLPSDDVWKSCFNFNLVRETRPVTDEDAGETPHTKQEETTLKLNCYPGTYLNPVNNITAGLRLSFKETLDIDNVPHERCVKITGQLPDYMIVHMVRFEWKKANDLARTAACRAKILRRIEYPEVLDIYEFCDDELKEVLQVGRATDDITEAPPNGNYEDRIADGTYAIKAVVTHRGRTVEDGHYICWVWQAADKQWVKLDDDKSSIVDASKIDLQGGLADGHVPYILLYERRGQFIA